MAMEASHFTSSISLLLQASAPATKHQRRRSSCSNAVCLGRTSQRSPKNAEAHLRQRFADLNVLTAPATFLARRCGLRRDGSSCRARNNWFGGPNQQEEEEQAPETAPQKAAWPILERWDVPWGAKEISLGLAAWILSALLTGLFVSVVAAQVGVGRRHFSNADEQAVYVFIQQLAQTVAGLTVVDRAVTPYKPLSPDLFSIEWDSPFDLRRGWIVWGIMGIVYSGVAVSLASYITTLLHGQAPPRDETDALVQLMPIIGASPLSTGSLITVTGVLAPILEETIFRAFLMTSLTKWVSTPVAVLLSALAFAGAHLTPGEFPQLLALGIILGFSYAQTRNLLTPILIHSMWNSGVVVLLTFLRLQGYDLKDLI